MTSHDEAVTAAHSSTVCASVSGHNANPANIPRGNPEWLGGGEGIRGGRTDGADPPDELRCAQVISGQHHWSTDTYPWRPLQPRRKGGHVGHSDAATQQGTFSVLGVMCCYVWWMRR